MKKRYICEIDGKLMYICEWCGSVHELSDLKYESKLGFMCEQCITAIESRGEILVFEEVYICEKDGKLLMGLVSY